MEEMGVQEELGPTQQAHTPGSLTLWKQLPPSLAEHDGWLEGMAQDLYMERGQEEMGLLGPKVGESSGWGLGRGYKGSTRPVQGGRGGEGGDRGMEQSQLLIPCEPRVPCPGTLY